MREVVHIADLCCETALIANCEVLTMLVTAVGMLLSGWMHLIQLLPILNVARCRFEFYFAYCEAAFDSRYLQDYQIVWQRVGAPHTQPSLKQRLQAVSSQKYLSCEAEKTETPEKESRLPKLSADTITSALFALYCVLAGVVVARQPRMLMALVSFAAGQIGLKVISCPPVMSLVLKSTLAT